MTLQLSEGVLHSMLRDEKLLLHANVETQRFLYSKDKDIFDSKKKLRIMSANGLEHKLSSKQQEVLEMNKGLFNLFSNQVCVHSCILYPSYASMHSFAGLTVIAIYTSIYPILLNCIIKSRSLKKVYYEH